MSETKTKSADVVASGNWPDFPRELYEGCRWRTVVCWRGDADVVPNGTEIWEERELKDPEIRVDVSEFLSTSPLDYMLPTCVDYKCADGMIVRFSLDLGKSKQTDEDNVVIFTAEIVGEEVGENWDGG